MSLKSPFTTQIERGGYSTIVHLDGDVYVAEDDVGTIIEESTVGGTSIQAAIDAQPAMGGKILMGSGYFNAIAPVLMKSYVTLDGLGPRSSILTGKANMACVVSFPSGTQHTQAGLRNLRIDNDFAYTVTSVIDAYNLEYSTFENLYIAGNGYGIYLRMHETGKTAYVNSLINVYTQMAATANECLFLGDSDNKVIGGTYFEGKGILISTGANYNLLSGVHIAGSSNYGLYTGVNYGGRIVECEIENNAGIGINLYRGSVANQWLVIANNNLYLNTTRDIHADNVKAVTITGNTCASALATSISTINNSDYNIIVGNVTDGAISTVGANNEIAHNVVV